MFILKHEFWYMIVINYILLCSYLNQIIWTNSKIRTIFGHTRTCWDHIRTYSEHIRIILGHIRTTFGSDHTWIYSDMFGTYSDHTWTYSDHIRTYSDNTWHIRSIFIIFRAYLKASWGRTFSASWAQIRRASLGQTFRASLERTSGRASAYLNLPRGFGSTVASSASFHTEGRGSWEAEICSAPLWLGPCYLPWAWSPLLLQPPSPQQTLHCAQPRRLEKGMRLEP